MQIIGGLTTSRPPKVKNHIHYVHVLADTVQNHSTLWLHVGDAVSLLSISVVILRTSSSYCPCLVHAEVISKE
jgi:hypothetical protein